MKNPLIVFPDSRNEFITELREKVNRYFKEGNISKYGNASLVTKSLLMLMLYVTPYAIMLTGVVDKVWIMFIAWFIMGIGLAGMGMVLMHDANHKSFSKKRSVNKVLSNSAYILGVYPKNWRFQHNILHHGYTNIAGHDEDISPAGILRFSPHSPLHKYHKYQYLYAWLLYSLMTFSWVVAKDFERLYRYRTLNISLHDPRKFKKSLWELIISKVVYYVVFLVIPILFVPISWYWIVLGFLTMHFVSGLSLSTIFQTAHVMPDNTFPLPDDNLKMENTWAMHQLLTTSDYSPNSKIFSWLIGGLNYQIEHHLFPTISHVHYKNIAKIVKETATKYHIPYHVEGNFFKAIIQHARMLKKLGTQV